LQASQETVPVPVSPHSGQRDPGAAHFRVDSTYRNAVLDANGTAMNDPEALFAVGDSIVEDAVV
jgi:hypothetical protein